MMAGLDGLWGDSGITVTWSRPNCRVTHLNQGEEMIEQIKTYFWLINFVWMNLAY